VKNEVKGEESHTQPTLVGGRGGTPSNEGFPYEKAKKLQRGPIDHAQPGGVTKGNFRGKGKNYCFSMKIGKGGRFGKRIGRAR